MRKFLKVVGVLFIIIIVGIAAFYIYMLKAFPKIAPAKDLKVEVTPQRIQRGNYLINHVTGCIGCHSERDFNKFAGPIKPGTEGMGGELFGEAEGFPGSFYARNITPEGIGSWTDGELYRAITSGVSKDGDPLFPVMPYLHIGNMDEEDVMCIIVAIRQLKPVKNEVPKSKAKFPMNIIMRTIPTEPSFQKVPSEKDTIEYGRYLVNASSCIDCHTKQEKGKFLPGMEFAGGFELPFDNGFVVRTANITPDEETGIGKWTRDQFVLKFKSYDRPYDTFAPVKTGNFNTWMPWSYYSGMTEGDLSAIYAYLRTVKPVQNKVVKFSQIGVN